MQILQPPPKKRGNYSDTRTPPMIMQSAIERTLLRLGVASNDARKEESTSSQKEESTFSRERYEGRDHMNHNEKRSMKKKKRVLDDSCDNDDSFVTRWKELLAKRSKPSVEKKETVANMKAMGAKMQIVLPSDSDGEEGESMSVHQIKPPLKSSDNGKATISASKLSPFMAQACTDPKKVVKKAEEESIPSHDDPENFDRKLHQWRNDNYIYGLRTISEEDAEELEDSCKDAIGYDMSANPFSPQKCTKSEGKAVVAEDDSFVLGDHDVTDSEEVEQHNMKKYEADTSKFMSNAGPSNGGSFYREDMVIRFLKSVKKETLQILLEDAGVYERFPTTEQMAARVCNVIMSYK